MKTRNWIIIVSAVLIILGAFFFTDNEVPEESFPDSDVLTTEGSPPFELLKNTEIVAPDSDKLIKLTDGTGSYEIIPGSASRGNVAVLDKIYALHTENGRTDLVVVLTSNTGGSGTFYYLVLFDISGNVLTKRSEMFLGDRIQVSLVGIGELVHDPEAEYRVTVGTLIREEGEAFAVEPTVPETRTFYVTNQVLEEVEVGQDDT